MRKRMPLIIICSPFLRDAGMDACVSSSVIACICLYFDATQQHKKRKSWSRANDRFIGESLNARAIHHSTALSLCFTQAFSFSVGLGGGGV